MFRDLANSADAYDLEALLEVCVSTVAFRVPVSPVRPENNAGCRHTPILERFWQAR